jgi:glycine/D-amino acid oxidase-like deaminating enzyme
VKDGLLSSYPPLRNDISCDVAIIGGGLSGALAAYKLAKRGVDCVVLDGRDIAFGSTCASTALVMYETDKQLYELIRLRGELAAVRAYQLCKQAVSELERLCKKLSPESCCGFERKKSLYLSRNLKESRELRLEYEARSKHGFKVDLIDRNEVEANFSFTKHSALVTRYHDDAVLDPLAFTYCLLEHSTREGGTKVFARTRATAFRNSSSGLEIRTDRDFKVKCSKVVFATGYETFHYIKRKVLKLKSTYAIASEPIDDFNGWGYEECLIWEAERPYVYLRTTPDRRILVGGNDEDFVNPAHRDAFIPKKSISLLRKVRRLFPRMDIKIAYSWAGTFGETEDSLPFIGEIPEFPNAYFDLCFGANGTNFAQIGSEIIRDLYLGRKNSDMEIFGFRGRKSYRRNQE